MIESVDQLKNERPDLVEQFENMTKEQLLKQCYLECIDAINMEERVQVFMNECTDLSKTNYTPESIKSMIQTKQESELSIFCETTLEDIEGMDLEEVKNYIREQIR